MVLVGAVVLPHGALPFDNPASPSAPCRERSQLLPEPMQRKINSLYQGTLNAAEEIARLEPDLVLLHTPHGLCLSDSMAIYGNNSAKGTAEWNGHWSDFEVTVELHETISERLYGYLTDRQVKIEMIKTFAQFYEAPLRWGEVIPLWYLLQRMQKSPKFVILTHPRKLGTGQVEIEKLNVGRLISDFLCNIDHKLRIVVAISGDLSHTYATDCSNELYLPDPRSFLSTKVNHEAAISFERAIQGWVKGLDDLSLHSKQDPLPDSPGYWNPGNGMAWITKAANIHPQALSCGMTGFMVLHGLLAGYVAKGLVFKPRVHTCEAPTYYGMLAATFMVT